MICQVSDAFAPHASALFLLVTDSVCITGFTCARLVPSSNITGSIADESNSSSVNFKPPVGLALKICASMLKRPESAVVPTPFLLVCA